jgi:hypothetical protein
VARRGVSNKKIRRRTPPGGATSSGTPRGRRHATTSGNLVIPMRKVGIKCSRVRGRVHRHVGGGEVIRDLILRESEERRGAHDVELGAFYFFSFEKNIGGN